MVIYMCGRFTLTISKENLKEYLFKKFAITTFTFEKYTPRYNVSPTQEALSIISDGKKYRAGFLKWGFIPNFAKDEKVFFINTRAETIDEKQTFKDAFLHKRCVILADGYFEWKKSDKKKIPHYILLQENKVFAFA